MDSTSDWKTKFHKSFAESIGFATREGIKTVNGAHFQYERTFQAAFVAELKKNKQLTVVSGSVTLED